MQLTNPGEIALIPPLLRMAKPTKVSSVFRNGRRPLRSHSKRPDWSERVLIGLWALFCVSCGQARQESPAPQQDVRAATSPASLPKFADAPVAELKKYRIRLDTAVGKIEIALYPEQAPEHVRRFLRLCQLGFYDHTAWHRVVRGFVIQGGDLGTRQPPLLPAEIDYYARPLPLELSRLRHEAGTVAMARGQALNSATTSFYICLRPQPALDGKYTIFGKVVSGMDVVDRISAVSLAEGDRPRQRWELRNTEIFQTPSTAAEAAGAK